MRTLANGRGSWPARPAQRQPITTLEPRDGANETHAGGGDNRARLQGIRDPETASPRVRPSFKGDQLQSRGGRVTVKITN